MSIVKQGTKPAPRKFSGYHRHHPSQNPEAAYRQVGRGTLGGEYLRRFWHPVAYERELEGGLPLRIRALGEDLVIYRDGEGTIGVLHMNCCHRNASLEYGIVEKRGLRCCYHGRLFDSDGAILEMPGETPEFMAKNAAVQGAYPVTNHHGLVFIYMGPPECMPVFPVLDRYKVANIKHVQGDRWPIDCNWQQVRENTVDPAHTATLHALPQYRGTKQFADEFGTFPAFMNWFETPGGMMYMVVRLLENSVWVRTTECIGPTISGITSIYENGRVKKWSTDPFATIYLLPVDDHHSLQFYHHHLSPNEVVPFEERRQTMNYGQTSDRPYKDRQYIPNDCEALEGQGLMADHSTENLGTNDRGVVMFRRYLKRGIEAVQDGQNPHGVYFDEREVPPTFTNDAVFDLSEIGDVTDQAVLKKFTETLFQDFLKRPPVRELIKKRHGVSV